MICDTEQFTFRTLTRDEHQLDLGEHVSVCTSWQLREVEHRFAEAAEGQVVLSLVSRGLSEVSQVFQNESAEDGDAPPAFCELLEVLVLEWTLHYQRAVWNSAEPNNLV